MGSEVTLSTKINSIISQKDKCAPREPTVYHVHVNQKCPMKQCAKPEIPRKCNHEYKYNFTCLVEDEEKEPTLIVLEDEKLGEGLRKYVKKLTRLLDRDDESECCSCSDSCTNRSSFIKTSITSSKSAPCPCCEPKKYCVCCKNPCCNIKCEDNVKPRRRPFDHRVCFIDDPPYTRKKCQSICPFPVCCQCRCLESEDDCDSVIKFGSNCQKIKKRVALRSFPPCGKCWDDVETRYNITFKPCNKHMNEYIFNRYAVPKWVVKNDLGC